MLKPDFTRYSLAIFEEERLLHSAAGGGLWPLRDALEKYRDHNGLILHDKIMGLAAARMIVYSGTIAEIAAGVASIPAKAFLEEKGIGLSASEVADNILTQDRSAVCHGEVIALETQEPDAFMKKICAMLEHPVRISGWQK
jgi:hypothetical protein